MVLVKNDILTGLMGSQHGSLKLIVLLCIQGLSLSAAQDDLKRLTETVGGAVTFPAPVQTTGSFVFGEKDLVVVFKGISDASFNENFRDRVQWDSQSGLFTLRELKTEDSGTYTVKNSKEQTAVIFHLTVYNSVSRPQVRVADHVSCSVECSVENGREVTLSWYRGEERLNQTSSPDLSTKLVLLLWAERGSNSIYSCVADNPASYQTTTVNTTELCTVSHEREKKAGVYRTRTAIIAVLCVAVSAGVVGLVVYLKRKRGENSQQVSGSPESEGQDDVLYSTVTIIDTKRAEQRDLPELDADTERERLTTVYDKLQLHRVGTPSSAPPPVAPPPSPRSLSQA